MSQLINGGYSSIEQMTELVRNANSKRIQNQNHSGAVKSFHEGKSFNEVLDSVRSNELIFSKHANERLLSRNIDLSDSQLERLQNGTRRAEEKGIKESLVMVDNLAFIVNVRNNTVITAVNEKEDKVFTNIDGAVIA